MSLASNFIVEELFLGKTFDDFSLSPGCGQAMHRNDISLSTKFSRNIKLNLPVVSANMSTVTGSEMCIALAREGGIGILPRSKSISISEQSDRVRQVKRADGLIIEDPYTIRYNQTLRDAKDLMDRYKVGTLLVVNADGTSLTGILTARRRMRLVSETDYDSTLVVETMTPINETEYSRATITSIEGAFQELKKYDREKLPLVGEEMNIRGLITMRDISNLMHHQWANKDSRGRLRVGAAIGVTEDYLERAAELVRAEVDVIVMDTAHAHNRKVVLPAIEKFKKTFGEFELVCGNVATYEGAKFLHHLVSGIKVGIGPGAGCLTRDETGVGVAQLDAIRSAYLASSGVPCIADGGCRKIADIAKALLIGGSSVMLGEMLAGTDEAPGEIINDPKKGKIKIYSGETSAQLKFRGGGSGNIINVEGQAKEIKYEGSVIEKLSRIRHGLQSMVSYMGGGDLATVMKKVSGDPCRYFRPASLATQRESHDK